jgi:hypothetical protein
VPRLDRQLLRRLITDGVCPRLLEAPRCELDSDSATERVAHRDEKPSGSIGRQPFVIFDGIVDVLG